MCRITTGIASSVSGLNSLAAFADTTTPMISRIATCEMIGRTGVTFSIFSLKIMWQVTPSATGTSTIVSALKNSDCHGIAT